MIALNLLGVALPTGPGSGLDMQGEATDLVAKSFSDTLGPEQDQSGLQDVNLPGSDAEPTVAGLSWLVPTLSIPVPDPADAAGLLLDGYGQAPAELDTFMEGPRTGAEPDLPRPSAVDDPTLPKARSGREDDRGLPGPGSPSKPAASGEGGLLITADDAQPARGVAPESVVLDIPGGKANAESSVDPGISKGLPTRIFPSEMAPREDPDPRSRLRPTELSEAPPPPSIYGRTPERAPALLPSPTGNEVFALPRQGDAVLAVPQMPDEPAAGEGGRVSEGFQRGAQQSRWQTETGPKNATQRPADQAPSGLPGRTALPPESLATSEAVAWTAAPVALVEAKPVGRAVRQAMIESAPATARQERMGRADAMSALYAAEPEAQLLRPIASAALLPEAASEGTRPLLNTLPGVPDRGSAHSSTSLQRSALLPVASLPPDAPQHPLGGSGEVSGGHSGRIRAAAVVPMSAPDAAAGHKLSPRSLPEVDFMRLASAKIRPASTAVTAVWPPTAILPDGSQPEVGALDRRSTLAGAGLRRSPDPQPTAPRIPDPSQDRPQSGEDLKLRAMVSDPAALSFAQRMGPVTASEEGTREGGTRRTQAVERADRVPNGYRGNPTLPVIETRTRHYDPDPVAIRKVEKDRPALAGKIVGGDGPLVTPEVRLVERTSVVERSDAQPGEVGPRDVGAGPPRSALAKTEPGRGPLRTEVRERLTPEPSVIADNDKQHPALPVALTPIDSLWTAFGTSRPRPWDVPVRAAATGAMPEGAALPVQARPVSIVASSLVSPQNGAQFATGGTLEDRPFSPGRDATLDAQSVPSGSPNSGLPTWAGDSRFPGQESLAVGLPIVPWPPMTPFPANLVAPSRLVSPVVQRQSEPDARRPTAPWPGLDKAAQTPHLQLDRPAVSVAAAQPRVAEQVDETLPPPSPGPMTPFPPPPHAPAVALPMRPEPQPPVEMPPAFADRNMPRDMPTVLTRGAERAREEGQVELVLDPVELGRVRFELTATSTERVQVNVVVERPETLDLLRRNMDGLREEFRAAGFDAASLNFSQWGSGRERPMEGPDPMTGHLAEPEGLEGPVLPAPNRNASRHGLDLRV